MLTFFVAVVGVGQGLQSFLERLQTVEIGILQANVSRNDLRNVPVGQVELRGPAVRPQGLFSRRLVVEIGRLARIHPQAKDLVKEGKNVLLGRHIQVDMFQ